MSLDRENLRAPSERGISELRILTAADLNQLRVLRLAGILESPAAFAQTATEFEQMSDAELLGWIGPNPDKFVVGAFSADSNLVGMCGITRRSLARIRHKAMIWGVYVHPEFRKQGISKQLLAKLLEEARAVSGLTQIQLTVAAPQTAAMQLYRSVGFKEFGTEPGALQVNDEFLDEIHMFLPIASED